MTTEALTLIDEGMLELGLNYEFMEWTSEPVYPYFVGEYQERESVSENGMQETQFILSGFSRSTWEALEDAKDKISNYFSSITGKTVISPSGVGIAVFYLNSLVIPTGDGELKKIQINLLIQEWKVN